MFKRTNIAERMTMETTPPIVIPTGADDTRSESPAEWRDLLLLMYIPKILLGLALAVLCLTPNATFACETSKPLQVPLEGAGQTPFYETLGSMELFKVRKIAGSLESRSFKRIDDKKIDEDTPLPQANLALKNAISGQVVKVFTTDNQGRFEITGVPRGLYVLWIVQGDKPSRPQKIEGGLLIELGADAKNERLPLMALSMSDCGMDVHKKNDGNSLNQEQESINAQTH